MAIRPPDAPPDDRFEAWILSREKLVVGAVLLVALALRIWHLLETRENDPYFNLPSVDPKVYHDWATRIAAGDWVGDGVFFLSPLYPYFLAVIYSLTGPSILAAKVVQLLIGTANCLLVYSLGRQVFDARTGLLAAGMGAVYSMSIFYDGILLITAIQTPLNLATVLLLLRAERSWRPRDWFVAGACLGLSALARPNVLLFPGFVIAWLYLGFRGQHSMRKVTTSAALFCIGIGLLVFPVTARNYFVGHDLVLVSSQGGVNFYIGNGPDANGVFNVPSLFPATLADAPLQQREAYRRVAEEDAGTVLSPSDVSAYWNDRTWEYITQHPGEWLRTVATKLGLYVNRFEFGNSRNYYSSRRFSAVLELPLLSFAVVAPLALLGMGLTIRRPRKSFYLHAMVLTFAVSLLMFFVLSHYRMPVIPFFWLFAAYAVVWLWDRLTDWGRARGEYAWPLLAAGIGLVMAIGVVQLDLGPADGPTVSFMTHYNLGNRYRQLGQRDLAIAEYRSAIELNPTYISAHNNLGLLCEEDPLDFQCAYEAWMRVLELARTRLDNQYFSRAQQHLDWLRSQGGRSPPGGDGLN